MSPAALALLLVLPASAVPETKAPASTSVPVAVEATPWSVGMGYYPREKGRFDITYRLRWDLDDVIDSPRALGAGILHPLGTLDSTFRGVLRGTRLDLYGLRVRPWKMLPRLQPSGPAVAASSGTAQAPPGAVPPPLPMFNFDPLLEDLRESARTAPQRWMIREGFDRAVPSSRGRGYSEKEAAGEFLINETRSWGTELEPALD